ncbi:hypothetical protein H6P81_015862 [Aristolochia fimbriata]|uniref:PHD-type domain-containing protein n=1 Tax=Aristolochia fimbriata TaxID=158543 RepID=A0AAV7EAH2_ARIFI|nr:hypothetical protein H6P81_015862 [Aristolochia fimbriata]
MEEVYSICGVPCYAELMVLCDDCNQVSEHIYCMRNHLDEVPDIWFCEACQSSSYRPDLTLEDIEKLIDDLVRETTTVWQMDEFRCRKPTTIDEAKAGVGRGCCEPFFLFILLAPTSLYPS